MKAQRTSGNPSATQRQSRKRSGNAAVAPAAAARSRKRPAGRGNAGADAERSVHYSPSGDPDQRRDDEARPSPEGPSARGRGDSDVEGIHDRSNNVERE